MGASCGVTEHETSEREDRRGRNAPRRSSFFQRLRNNFLTGIVVVAPFAITLYLTLTIVAYIDDTILPQILPLIPERYHPQNILPVNPLGLGVVVIVVALIFIGSLTKNFFGRELIKFTERSMERMPVVRSLYNGLKQIVETIFQQSQGSFDRACLVEYPRRGLWAVAFVSTKATGEIPKKAVDGGEMMGVFLPTTPNPTSGFLLFVPKEDVILLDMSVEEAAKLVISAGLVTPADLHDAEATRAALEAAKSDAARAAIRQEIDRSGRKGPRSREDGASPAAAAEAAARNPFRSL